MKYLKPVTGFRLELPEIALAIVVKGYKIIKDIVPSTYGDIMKDLPLSDDVTLESLNFYEVFENLMNKSKLFLEDKALDKKNLFFLRKCGVYGTYHWVRVHAWSESGYCIAENPNVNHFVEPWRNSAGRKHLLEDSIFFVLQSKKKMSSPITCSTCGKELTTKEIMSKIMHIGVYDGSPNCQEGKVYCEKCKL